MSRLVPILALLVALVSATACNEEGVVRIRSLTFNGVRAVRTDDLKNALATRVDSTIPVIGFRFPWSRTRNAFDQRRLDADLQRIQAFYADRGFPDAKVTSVDVKLNAKQDAIDVSLTIDEGTPIRVAAVRVVGFDAALPPDHFTELTRQTIVTVGQPRAQQAVLAVHDLALNELRDHGFPYAKVTTAEEIGASGTDATITLTAESGPLSHFGPLEIAGNKSVGEAEIRRHLAFKAGDLYRRSLVEETERRLLGMELFQFVNIETLNPEAQAPEVTTRLTVAEGKHQRFNGGVGYGTEDQFRVEGDYRHVNFLGDARSAEAQARYSQLDRGVRLDFIQPYLFSPKLSLDVGGQDWYTFTPSFDSVVTGAKIGVVLNRGSRSTLSVSLSSERNKSTVKSNDPTLRDDLIALGLDPDTGSQDGTIGALGIDWQHATTDNPLNARRGYSLAVHVEDAGHLLPGTFHYRAFSGDARHFLPVSENLVIASRIQAGTIQPQNHDPTEVPFSRKYFLGGASSIRGWGRFEVSPLSSNGEPIGGNTFFAVSSEARARLVGNIGGVLFADGGNVWATDSGGVGGSSLSVTDLKWAAGVGLRYETPIGPVRLDWGYQLTPTDTLVISGQPETRRWRIHFSIGQAF
ncbi:MAG: BamA/TamA family outer membrane protein [Acidobacteriaceae bacterium]|jgi:outer membrane protein insertion porin family/translocation and assembly module TamA|nr:BamA/TamA family outer membrane protein [Acidobacteriaceae bacterium]